MGKRRNEEDEVSVFNMSFLDVFCCTIGALIFILFLQIVRTRDMVEKTVLEDVREKLAVAQLDLSKTVQATEAMNRELSELTENVQKAKSELVLSKKELKVKDDKIGDLLEQLKDPGRIPPPSILSDLKKASFGSRQIGGRAVEGQKLAQGKYLLGNLETKTVVCAGEGIYLGTSRKAMSLQDRALPSAFRTFLRYHDPRQEGLWRTAWGDGMRSYEKSLSLEAAEKAETGKGLVVRKETALVAAQDSINKTKTQSVDMDLDGDGVKETRFEDTNADGLLDVKRVNLDGDPFFEEVYLDYDSALKQWGQVLVDTEGDDKYDLLLQDTVKSDSDYEMKYIQPNLQHGNALLQYEDRDNDGLWDVKYENTDLTNDSWEKTYALFDSGDQRWGALMLDSNGDGKPDVMWRDMDMSNDDWEEKLEDTDGDGVWDIRWKDMDPRDSDWEAKFTQRKGTTDIWQRCEVDSDEDGTMDTMLVDVNGDGVWDEENSYDSTAKEWVKKD